MGLLLRKVLVEVEEVVALEALLQELLGTNSSSNKASGRRLAPPRLPLVLRRRSSNRVFSLLRLHFSEMNNQEREIPKKQTCKKEESCTLKKMISVVFTCF